MTTMVLINTQIGFFFHQASFKLQIFSFIVCPVCATDMENVEEKKNLFQTHNSSNLRKFLTEAECEGQQHPHQTWPRPHLLSHVWTTASDFNSAVCKSKNI